MAVALENQPKFCFSLCIVIRNKKLQSKATLDILCIITIDIFSLYRAFITQLMTKKKEHAQIIQKMFTENQSLKVRKISMITIMKI